MTPEMHEMIKNLRVSCPRDLALEICSVQPIDPKPYQDIYRILKENPGHSLVLTSGNKLNKIP